jgi:putative ATP-dependent endonuclease of the OLD family
VPADKIEQMIAHPTDGLGNRLRTLAIRLGIEDKSIAKIREAANGRIVPIIIEAATGTVPVGKDEEKKTYKNHASVWFKSVEGGQEVADKMMAMGLWPQFKPHLMPFVNAVRNAVGLQQIEDLPD